MSMVGIGGHPMPGVEFEHQPDGSVAVRPPSLRTLPEVREVESGCMRCQETDRKGEKLFRFHEGGAFTCGVYRGGCGKDEGDGMGCILNFAWMLKHKHCERGHW